MKFYTFAKRCAKEIIRDPLNLVFGLGFPVILLLLLSAIQSNVPVELFEIKKLTPGITVFGLSFMTLFSATLIARDRETAFLQRLYTTPLRPQDYILGYMLPILPIAMAQSAACYLVGFTLGMPVTVNIIYAVFMTAPICILYIGLGLLCGSIFNVKQVGGICGALLTNLSAWLSGIWFDLDLVGGIFSKVANYLPFIHAVQIQRSIVSGNYDSIVADLLIVLGYSAVITLCAVFFFLRQMKRQ